MRGFTLQSVVWRHAALPVMLNKASAFTLVVPDDVAL